MRIIDFGSIPVGSITASDEANHKYTFEDSGEADKVVIIKQQNNDKAPDDAAKGSIKNTVIDRLSTFNDIGILNFDNLRGDHSHSFIRFVEETDNTTGQPNSIAELGNNPYQESNFGLGEVTQMEFELGVSGAISGLNFTAVPEPSAYGVIGTAFLIGLIYFRRRKLSWFAGQPCDYTRKAQLLEAAFFVLIPTFREIHW